MRKQWKIYSLYSFNRKRSCKNWWKWRRSHKNISYILEFIDSARFIASSLSHLVHNLSEGLDKIKCKSEHDDKKWETCGIKYKYCDCFLECTNFKDDLT